MKWKGRRQSTNVETQTPQQAIVARAGVALKNKTIASGRALDPEPIASTKRKTPLESHADLKRNPAKTLKAKDRPVEGSPPDFQHFKHTTKGK